MRLRKWFLLLVGILVLVLTVVAVTGFLGFKTYVVNSLIPDLEQRLRVEIVFSHLTLHPAKGITIQDLSIQPSQQENSSRPLFFKQVTFWSPPWKWLGNGTIPFQYTLSGVQKTALQIQGKGSWDRREKKLILDPVFDWPKGSKILFPLDSHSWFNFQTPKQSEWQVDLKTSSGIQTEIHGQKTQNGYRIHPSWVRFQNSLLEYNGDYLSPPQTQLYLETTGNLELSELEKLLSGQDKIFSKIDSKLDRIEAGIVLENQQLIIEDFLADYRQGTLSIRGVTNLVLPYRFRFSLRGDEMELAETFKVSPPPDASKSTKTRKKKRTIKGTTSWTLTLQGEGTDLDKLEGQGKFEIWKGDLWELNLFSGLARVLQAPQLEQVIFDEASGHFLITEKKVVFPHVQLRSPQLILDGKGSMGLKDRGVDFVVTATFSQDFLGQIRRTPTGLLTTLLTTPEGKALVQVRVSGTWEDLEYKLQPITPGQFLQRFFQGIAPQEK